MKNNIIKKIFVVLILLIAVIVILFFVSKGIKKNSILHKEYLSGVKYYEINNDSIENKKNSILHDVEDYNELINNYKLDVNADLDFANYDYIYYIMYVNSCGEEVVGVSNIDINNNKVNITFDVKYKCGVCASVGRIYFIPIEENILINEVNVNYETLTAEKCEKNIADKPILYLYPTKDMDVSVRLEKDNLLMTTYPKYNNGWNVYVNKEGSIYDKKGNYYYALYWDEQNNNKVDFSTGFYVEKENAIEFLEDKLSYIGLNDKERNEFIMYWLPKLEDNGKSLVYFELTEERELNNKLYINPKPDSMLRINMHIKKVNKKISIKMQKLDAFVRRGFTAVEWGGTIHR